MQHDEKIALRKSEEDVITKAENSRNKVFFCLIHQTILSLNTYLR